MHNILSCFYRKGLSWQLMLEITRPTNSKANSVCCFSLSISISLRSPRKVFILIIKKYIYWIQVSKTHLIPVWKQNPWRRQLKIWVLNTCKPQKLLVLQEQNTQFFIRPLNKGQCVVCAWSFRCWHTTFYCRAAKHSNTLTLLLWVRPEKQINIQILFWTRFVTFATMTDSPTILFECFFVLFFGVNI